MTIRDSRGLALTTAFARSAERYDAAVDLLASYRLDPLAAIDAAIAEDPDFVSAHCLRAGIGVLAAERAGEPLIQSSLAAGRRLAPKANDRERQHFAAAEAWLDGEFHRASGLYEKIVLEYPRDLVALQIAHVLDFYLGQQRMLRDRVVHVLPDWDADTPGFGHVLGMLAFGLEETNLFERAEVTGRRALELERRDAWAVHAVTHVYEMNSRVESGIEWLRSRMEDWARDNSLACHNFWHLALFLLRDGKPGPVLEVFDQHIWPRPSAVALEMVDAASLLWRLHLRGVELGGRAASVADAWSDGSYHGYYAFNDVHATMASVAGGKLPQARAIVATLERRAAERGSNPTMSREVGLPLARAIVAFGEGRHGDVVEALWPLRLTAQIFGGSNAQRDVIDQTLLESAKRAGNRELFRALESERRLWAS